MANLSSFLTFNITIRKGYLPRLWHFYDIICFRLVLFYPFPQSTHACLKFNLWLLQLQAMMHFSSTSPRKYLTRLWLCHPKSHIKNFLPFSLFFDELQMAYHQTYLFFQSCFAKSLTTCQRSMFVFNSRKQEWAVATFKLSWLKTVQKIECCFSVFLCALLSSASWPSDCNKLRFFFCPRNRSLRSSHYCIQSF